MYKLGPLELLLPHGRGENHRQVQPGCREDGEGKSGGDDDERQTRRSGRAGRGVLQDLGLQEQQCSGVLDPGPQRSHGGPLRGAYRPGEQEPPFDLCHF